MVTGNVWASSFLPPSPGCMFHISVTERISAMHFANVYLKALFFLIPSRRCLQLRTPSLHACDNRMAFMVSRTSGLKMANHRWIQEHMRERRPLQFDQK